MKKSCMIGETSKDLLLKLTVHLKGQDKLDSGKDKLVPLKMLYKKGSSE